MNFIRLLCLVVCLLFSGECSQASGVSWFSGFFLSVPLNHFARKSAFDLIAGAAASWPLVGAPEDDNPAEVVVVAAVVEVVVEVTWCAWKEARGVRPVPLTDGFLATCLGAIDVRVALTTVGAAVLAAAAVGGGGGGGMAELDDAASAT